MREDSLNAILDELGVEERKLLKMRANPFDPSTSTVAAPDQSLAALVERLRLKVAELERLLAMLERI